MGALVRKDARAAAPFVAAALAFVVGFSVVAMALPAFMAEREPPVPPPASISSLSPWTRRILSKGTPSLSTSTWAKGVQWPWP